MVRMRGANGGAIVWLPIDALGEWGVGEWGKYGMVSRVSGVKQGGVNGVSGAGGVSGGSGASKVGRMSGMSGLSYPTFFTGVFGVGWSLIGDSSCSIKWQIRATAPRANRASEAPGKRATDSITIKNGWHFGHETVTGGGAREGAVYGG